MTDNIFLGLPTHPDEDYFNELSSRIWQSRRYSNFGPLHDELETELTQLLQVAHGRLTSSGTSALQLALTSLSPGGEVITTPATFAATVGAIVAAGLKPVFVDVDPATWNIDPTLVEDALTPRTVAILAVHLFGVPCDTAALQQIASEHGVRLIYDAAHAFGVLHQGRGIGAFGDATAFSLHATKLMHTGEGGMLATSEKLRDLLTRARNFGLVDGRPRGPGINAKLPELSAALGLSVLRRLPQERAARARLRSAYDRTLTPLPGVSKQEIPPATSPPELFYALHVAGGTRDRLLRRLAEVGINGRAFPLVCGLGTAFPEASILARQETPEAVRFARDVLCLPFHSGVAAEHVALIGTTAADVLRP